jgi:hypothetical protein
MQRAASSWAAENHGELAFGANGLEHVVKILADGHFFVRFRFGCHLEDIREDVTLGVVINDLDTALFVIAQRAENSRILTHIPPAIRETCHKGAEKG